jgi:hypothetical protein
MKTMTCKQLGGACDLRFHAETFQEMANLSKNHGMEMLQKKDRDHMDAMKKIAQLMQDPNAMNDWFESKKKQFDELPNN